jgi:arylsulfatase A-like enzyme
MKLFAAALLAALTAPATAMQKPNILFLFADDQRPDTIGALGNPHIKTPHLDKLVRRGVSFNHAYMQGGNNAATCVPSRAMLLTGQSLWRIDENMRGDSWPQAFARGGYATFMSGKWHNGRASLQANFPNAKQVFVGGMTDPMKAQLGDVKDGKLSPPEIGKKHACEIFADEAIAFIKEQNDKPFFCYVPFDAPHDPHVVPDEFPVHYDPETLSAPTNFLAQHPFDNGEMTIRDEVLLPWPRTPEKVRAFNAEYYRYISYLDAQIGRILEALEASPHAKNTIVVFAADSGVARGSHGLIGKQNLYEHSIRVPLIFAGPGIAEDKRSDALCYLFDVFPTLGKMCDIEAPQGSEGINLGAALKNPQKPARKSLFFGYKTQQRAVFDGRWKLIRYPQVDVTQLFDLQSDPDEKTDLSNKPEHAAKISALMTLLQTQQKLFDDKAPLRVDTPKPAAWSPPR